MPPADPVAPRAHLRPERGWLNDPNGPFRWQGRYHLFFQHNPNAPQHGEICWGHASSAHLATWDLEPVALRPSSGGPDAGGCWSGCVVDDAGTPTAVYTGFVDDPAVATILLARAEDDGLRRWTKVAEPVAAAPGDLAGFRDPFLFDHEGHRYAVVGAGTRDGTAEVLVYRCDDLQRWEYAGQLLTGLDEVARTYAPAEIWECPQLFRLEDRWVLVLSLVRDDSLDRVAYLVGDLGTEDGAPRFSPTGGGLVDHGHACYAPAVLVEEHRVLLWGWSWEDRDEEEVLAAGWAGVLTWPRVLGLLEGERLVSRPAPELTALRRDSAEILLSAAPVPLPPGPVEVELTVTEPSTVRLGHRGAGLTLEVDPRQRTVLLRCPVHDPRFADWLTGGTVAGSGPVHASLVVDGSIVEVHVADGPVFTERLYPTDDSAWTLSCTGAAVHGTAHRLAAAIGG